MKQFLKRLLTSSFLALLVFLPTAQVFAHVESEGPGDSDIAAKIVEPDLFIAGTPTTIWLELKHKKTDTFISGIDISVEVHALSGEQEKEIFRGKAEAKKSEGGKDFYLTEVTFPTGGKYDIHYEFVYDGEEKKFEFPIFVAEQSKGSLLLWTTPAKIGGALVAIAFVALAVWGMRTKKYKKMIILLVVLAATSGVAYSLYYTVKSGALRGGVVTCLEDGSCVWTAHIHSYIVIKACGNEKILPAEVGSLGAVHTHEEKNIFHWHDRLPYDNVKKEIIDTKPLALDPSFRNVGVVFEKEKFFDLKNGDSCNGAEGTWRMFVNGKQNNQFQDYVWKDRDVIYLEFSERSNKEIEKELLDKPITFPTLGRG